VSRILVVEDEYDIRKTLTMLLKLQGFEVDGAAMIREAVKLLDVTDFDVVLLDLMLPDGRGTDVLAHIRADDARRDLPVIAMSAIEPAQRTEQEYELPFLQKPFTIAELTTAMEECGVELPEKAK
jgi:DNA-binding response OmpR family regulator